MGFFFGRKKTDSTDSSNSSNSSINSSPSSSNIYNSSDGGLIDNSRNSNLSSVGLDADLYGGGRFSNSSPSNGSSSSSNSLRDTSQAEGSQQAQQLVRLMVLQTLNQQVQKTCFGKCFPGNKFHAELSRSDHLCLAKCMDRMYEAHAIVSQASAEMGQHVSSQGPGFM